MQPGEKRSDLWSVIQTIVLIATASGIFLTLGRRDKEITYNSAQLYELRLISRDLVKSQVLSGANDETHSETLRELRRRIEKLEDGRK